jgi:hypothetical protein
MARDHKAEYRRRQERAKQQGFESYAAKRKALEAADKGRSFPDRRTLVGKNWVGETSKAKAYREAWVTLEARGLKPKDKMSREDIRLIIQGLVKAKASPRTFFKGWYR